MGAGYLITRLAPTSSQLLRRCRPATETNDPTCLEQRIVKCFLGGLCQRSSGSAPRAQNGQNDRATAPFAGLS